MASSRRRSPKTKRPWRIEHRRLDRDPETEWSAFLPGRWCRTFIDKDAAIDACSEECFFNRGVDKRHAAKTRRQWRVRHKTTDEVVFELEVDLRRGK